MGTIRLSVNGVAHELDIEPDAPLLWVIRDELNLTGTKFGCGIGVCGACTVHVNGEAVRSCSVPVGSVANAEIITIEGLGAGGADPGSTGSGSNIRCHSVATASPA